MWETLFILQRVNALHFFARLFEHSLCGIYNNLKIHYPVSHAIFHFALFSLLFLCLACENAFCNCYYFHFVMHHMNVFHFELSIVPLNSERWKKTVSLSEDFPNWKFHIVKCFFHHVLLCTLFSFANKCSKYINMKYADCITSML